MARRGRTRFGCSRPATAQPFLTAATENSPVATCLDPSSMGSLSTWAVWSIVVPCVLLSPVIAFLLAIGAEVLVW
jgi:hypothetical protein